MYLNNLIGTFVSGLALANYAAAYDTHRVDVGREGLTFSPPSTNAAVGDVVEFVFYPRNHSVVQSSFSNPCRNTTGFYSGFLPVAEGVGNTTFRVTVNSTKTPIWFYCSQPGAGGHCTKGMVGCINCENSSNTLDAFIKAAGKTTPAQVTQPAVVGGGVLFQSSGSSSSSSSSTTAAASATSPPSVMSTPSPTTSAATSSPTNGANTLGDTKWTFLTIASGFLAFASLIL